MSAKQLETIRIQQLYYLKGKTEKARNLKEPEPPLPENARYLISDNFKLTENNERRKKCMHLLIQSLYMETTLLQSMNSLKVRYHK